MPLMSHSKNKEDSNRNLCRQATKPRRRLLFAALFSVILLLSGGYGVVSRIKHRSGHLAWPAVGQAAVGTAVDGVLVHSSDNEELRPIASMAKVITALAVMEKQPLKLGQEGHTYNITSKDVANLRAYIAKAGSVQPLLIGMELTQYQAMQRMLVASDNNMADILTERVFGSKKAYVSYAQYMLRRMGLSRTVVADASGFSPATVSTPSELAAIGIAALKNPVIAEIVAQRQVRITGIGMIKNTNQLLGTDGVIGIKTGTTDEAGHCLLFAARYAPRTVEQRQSSALLWATKMLRASTVTAGICLSRRSKLGRSALKNGRGCEPCHRAQRVLVVAQTEISFLFESPPRREQRDVFAIFDHPRRPRPASSPRTTENRH